MKAADQQRIAELRAQILAGVPMGQSHDVSTLLGISPVNITETLHEMRHQLLMFRVDGRDLYPLFQFNAKDRALYPEFIEILAIARMREWSPFRLVYWMQRLHAEFDPNPARALRSHPQQVKAAFLRAVEPQCHG